MQASKPQPLGSVATWHEEAERERERMHDGFALLAAARALGARIPRNALLLTRNEESAALVGAALAVTPAVAVTITWEPYHLGRESLPAHDGPVMLVEAGPIGEGLAATILERLPEAEILAEMASAPEPLRRVA